MSGFSSAALPGKIPTSGSGRDVTFESLMALRAEAQKALSAWPGGSFSAKSVKVCIFDLSDPVQRSEYERLQAELIARVAKGEVKVDDSRKDLVHRADGTSYWMKYVEYIELDKPGSSGKAGGE